ncbi:MAG: DUF1446 domain-containing protein [Actinomycetota bacterium]|nr:DUF1446 domain-containing protein [Actinomycetota bacterium]
MSERSELMANRATGRDPIRIANCSGFYGDRLSAAAEMVEGGPIDVLTGDWLAELTMLILARTRERRPGGGYAATFLRQMEQVLGPCLDRSIKVVANAGGLDPAGCAEALTGVAERIGVTPTIAVVTGDDLINRLDELGDALTPFGDTERVDLEGVVTANAYLGCWGIVEALAGGADVVITGRVTDAAVVCGPAAWHHGWAGDDWDALAGAVVAGHVIECGAQSTGGNYSFFTEIADLTHAGFPWAEVAHDGSCVIGKHEGTSGEVSIGTVTSQLLYEIAGPRYFGPDVTARFDTIALAGEGPDRVRISGVRGEPPPPTLKVATNAHGGYRNDMAIALTGLDIESKAALVERAFWAACPYEPDDFAQVTARLVRTDRDDPATNEQAVALWRLSVKDPDERKVGRAVSNAVTELALSTIPGMFGLGGAPSAGSPYGIYRPALVPVDLVPQYVTIGDASPIVIESVAPQATTSYDAELEADPDGASTGDDYGAVGRPTIRVPLGAVVGARSGDKGPDANLGVFARSDDAWRWLDTFLTVDRLRVLLPETAELTIERFRFPLIASLNFVIHGLLEEGVAASTRQDPQAKSLGEWLRARLVDVPTALLTERTERTERKAT